MPRTPGPEPLPYWTRCFPGGRTVEIATKHQEWTHEACNRIMAYDALAAERDALRKALRACITDEGAPCYQTGSVHALDCRIKGINAEARAALAKDGAK